MPRQAPYLQRRGDTLYFRLAVPEDLRPYVGGREITKTLRTTERARAVPVALEYAARVKRLFWELRGGMAEQDNEKLLELVKSKREALKLDDLRDQHQEELHQQRTKHLRELKQAKLEGENEAMRRVLAGFSSPPVVAYPSSSESAPGLSACVPVPTFKAVVDGFLGRYFRDIDREKRALNMLVTTAHFVEGRPVKKLIDVVGAQCVFGGGPMKDLFAGVRNLVGGRAASIQDLLSDARREAMIDLKRNAASLDANAIIAINIQHSEIAEGGTMIMVTATGTAVELADA